MQKQLLSLRNLVAVLLVAVVTSACSSAAERAQSYYENGMKLMAQHDYARAAVEFKNAVKAKKDFVPAWRGLAQIEEQNRNWNALVPPLRTIVELDPKDLESRLKLARL